MRRIAAVLASLCLLAGTVVLAQPRPAPRPAPRPPGAAPAPARPPARGPDAGTSATTAAQPAAAVSLDAGSAADSTALAVGDVAIPMQQVGTGTVIYFPIPEQLARTAVPVFVQIRSSAPIDHVSLYYRGVGARRFTELRMTAMGQQLRLPSGFGAQVPCDDIFPPRLEYYVHAIDQSGSPNGSAGSAETPLQMPIVERRSFPAPTLPGQPLPRHCGALTSTHPTHPAGTAPGGVQRGSADLGEPCTTNNDCRTGLRCGAHRQCVFDRAN